MKARTNILVLMTIAFIVLSCDPQNEPLNQSQDPPMSVVCGLEGVEGVVVNEGQEVLKGIKVEVYNDEALKDPYYPFAQVGEGVYTNDGGYYSVTKAVLPRGVDSVYVYLKASDPSGVYATQVKKGKIIFTKLPADGNKTMVGLGVVDFVLTKN